MMLAALQALTEIGLSLCAVGLTAIAWVKVDALLGGR